MKILTVTHRTLSVLLAVLLLTPPDYSFAVKSSILSTASDPSVRFQTDALAPRDCNVQPIPQTALEMRTEQYNTYTASKVRSGVTVVAIVAGAVALIGWVVDSFWHPIKVWTQTQQQDHTSPPTSRNEPETPATDSVRHSEILKVRGLIDGLLNGSAEAAKELAELPIVSVPVEEQLIRFLISEQTFDNSDTPSFKESLKPILKARLMLPNADDILQGLLRKTDFAEWTAIWDQLSQLNAMRRSEGSTLHFATEEQRKAFEDDLAIALQYDQTQESAIAIVQSQESPEAFGGAVEQARAQARIIWDTGSDPLNKALEPLAGLAPVEKPIDPEVMRKLFTAEAVEAALREDASLDTWATPAGVQKLAMAAADKAHQPDSNSASSLLEDIFVRHPGWRRALALYRMRHPELRTEKDPLAIINSPTPDPDLHRAFEALKLDPDGARAPVSPIAVENSLSALADRPRFGKPPASTLSVKLEARSSIPNTTDIVPSVYLESAPGVALTAGVSSRLILMLDVPSTVGATYGPSAVDITFTLPEGMTLLGTSSTPADIQKGKTIIESSSGNDVHILLLGLDSANEFTGRQAIAYVDVLISASVSSQLWGRVFVPTIDIRPAPGSSRQGYYVKVNVTPILTLVQMRGRDSGLAQVEGSYKTPLSDEDTKVAKAQVGLGDMAGNPWERLAKVLRRQIAAEVDIENSWVRKQFVNSAVYRARQDIQEVRDVILHAIDPRVVKKAQELLDSISEKANPFAQPPLVGHIPTIRPDRTLIAA